MKVLLKIVGGILVCLALVLVVLRITGLNPHDGIPGLWLTGDLVTTPVTDWSFTDEVPTIKLQTQSRFLLPHSVTINCLAYQGPALRFFRLSCRTAERLERECDARPPRAYKNRR